MNVLPDLRNRFLEGSDTGGQIISAGLPNIVGSYDYVHTTYPSPKAVDGAFDYEYVGRTDPGNVVGWIGLNKIIFDASRCSSIYGGSTTVQPPAVTVRYYIRAK